jgi:hypothetical protein
MNKKYDFKMLIDTLKIRTVGYNLVDYSSLNDKFSFIKKGSVHDEIRDGELYKTLIISANMEGEKYKPVFSMSEFEGILDNLYARMGIIESELVELNRIDIAVDSSMDYSENFKMILFLFELLTIECNKSDKWYTTNLRTLKNNTVISNGRSVEICFYDKKEESLGNHFANTRFEFRFKRVSSKDILLHINKVKCIVNNIDKSIEVLEENMSKRLLNLWTIEKDEVKSFSEFVRKYNKYFFTKNILKYVYKQSGLNGSYTNWIGNFRKTNELKFYSKSDALKFKKAVKKSLKDYINKKD